MKATRIFWALGCVAALSACTGNDEPQVAQQETRTVTFSLNVEQAATRAEYSDNGTAYQFSWTDGDALSVVYEEDGEVKNAKFTVSNASGGSADITGELPATVTTVGVYYPYIEKSSIAGGQSGYYFSDSDNGDFVNQSGLGNLGAYGCLGAVGVTVTDGALPATVKMQHLTSFLHFPAGYQFFKEDDTTTSLNQYITLQAIVGSTMHCGQVTYSPTAFAFPTQASITMYMKATGENFNGLTATAVAVSDGKIQSDIYLPFFLSESKELVMALTVWKTMYSNVSWSKGSDAPTGTFEPGYVYTVGADKYPAK